MQPARAIKEEERSCLLGVESSLRGKRWESRLADERLGLTLSQGFGLPEILGRALAARGIGMEGAEAYLAPRLRSALPDPSLLQDMDKAVSRILQAIEAGEGIAVFGDYDVDGATSSALLARFFGALGIKLRTYIPDRFAEGYGPNAPALRRLKDEGCSLVLTVDCGATAFEALSAAAESGQDVIVIDHHVVDAELPPAAALVNPNRQDDTSALGQLAAVGVTFLLVVALNRALRESGWYQRQDRAAPDLIDWLDLVALGTVCDVVSLTGLNRAFVSQGLKVMASRRNIGLAALGEAAGVSRPPGTYEAGFLLGPRINAGGRVGTPDLGVRLLATEDLALASDLAARLDELNRERREIEQGVLDQALLQAEEGPKDGLICVAQEGWHAGVIGIVASRLKDRFNLPALVIAEENGIGKGSARSVPGVDLGAEVLAARREGLLVNGGGHAMAAGLTVEAGSIPDLRAFLSERLARRIEESGYRPALGLDGALQVRGANADLVEMLQQMAPFGVGNPEPRFALTGVRIARPQVVGGGHLRCFLQGPDGARLKGIAFRAFDDGLGEALAKSGGLPYHLAGKLRPDDWAGPGEVQFIIEDAAPAG